MGEPFVVLPWQRRFLRGAWGQDEDSALSIARGNGKTTFLGAVATAAIDGPLRQQRAEVVVVASSFMQARILFEHVKGFLNLHDSRHASKAGWKMNDTHQNAFIEHVATGARLRCIASDPKRAHGLAPVLVLADEPAQWEAQKAEPMIAALRTGLGKIPDSRLVSLGTLPDTPEHWFSMMFTGVGSGYSQLHSAKKKDPPFQRRTWKKANPSLDHMPFLEKKIRAEAKDARRDPSLLASFMALRLNAGVSDTLQGMLLDAGTWERIEIDRGDLQPTGPYVLGVDLGGSAAMSAVAAYWPASGLLDSFACFPEVPSLAERGLNDGVGGRYREMHKRGELIVAGRRVADVPSVLREVITRWGPPAAVICDRWREQELRQALEKVSFPMSAVVVRGMGFMDGGQDVREFRRACGGGHVAPIRSLLMRSAMSEARTVVDPAGNSKLAKNAQGGRRLRVRDDAAAAAVLAVAEGHRGRDRITPNVSKVVMV